MLFMPVTHDPEIVLSGYAIMELETGSWKGKTYHFVGNDVRNGGGRTSTPIQVFDKEQMIGITASGRTYKLVENRVGFSDMGDSAYIFNMFFQANHGTFKKDVTEQFLSGNKRILKNLMDAEQSAETEHLKKARKARKKKPSKKEKELLDILMKSII